jgi:excisionase family DNA binding protein
MATHDTTTAQLTALSGGALLNAEQAAQYLSLSTSYIRKACAGNRIPFVRVGTRTLFRRVDLDGWIQERVVPTNSEVKARAEGIVATALLRKGGK